MNTRADSVGLFWEDHPEVGKVRGNRPRITPPVPDTGWIVPTEFPRLDQAKMLCIDTETKDEGLSEGKAPGTHRDDSYLVGIAVGTEDGHRWYFPMRHERGGNMDPEAVIAWAKDELTRPTQPKVGANIIYDLEWLGTEGIHVQGEFHDVQYSGPLLDEYSMSYSLEALGQRYLGEGKEGEPLYEWLAQAYGGNPTRRAQGGRIWRGPVELVGPYAESDVDLPIRLFEQHKRLMEQADLWDLYRLECDLIPLLLAMRQRGVRIDLEKAQRIEEEIPKRIILLQDELNGLAGCNVDVWAPQQFSRMFDKHSITYPRTAKGNPSFQKKWLENHGSKLCQLITEVRRWDKFYGTFIKGHILSNQVNGRIYTQFHPLRTDDNGAVSGRYSSSGPNLQNIPSRDPELGPLIRSMFIPEEGEEWVKHDYAQIEPRLLLHYAPSSAEAVRAIYRDQPTLNCYKGMMTKMPEGIGYRMMKDIYLGMTYSMGAPKLARQLNLTGEQGEHYFGMFHEGAPYVQEFRDKVQKVASNRGHLRTLLGRYARFPMWEHGRWFSDEQKDKIRKEKGDPKWFDPLPTREAAVAKWGSTKRAWIHKAVNRLIQGGAADVIKKAMLEVWKSGVCDVLGAPLLTVHDELDSSKPKTKEGDEAALEVKRILETCVSLRVPLLVDMETGPSWGEVK